jgi:hypothetical protein
VVGFYAMNNPWTTPHNLLLPSWVPHSMGKFKSINQSTIFNFRITAFIYYSSVQDRLLI